MPGSIIDQEVASEPDNPREILTEPALDWIGATKIDTRPDGRGVGKRRRASASGPVDDLAALLGAERQRVRQPMLESLLEARASSKGPGGDAEQPDAAAADRLLRRSAPWALDPGPLVVLLDAVADETDRSIFLGTVLGNGARIGLSRLAAAHGVSTTRIAQRRDRAARQVREAFGSASPPLPWLVGHVTRTLGRATTIEVARDELERLGIDPSVEHGVSLLLWLAGPFEEVPGSPGWLAVGPRGLIDVTEELLSRDGGVAPLAEVEEEVVGAGMGHPMVVHWLRARGAIVVDGSLVVRGSGKLVDVVERLVEALGRPVSQAELETMLAGGGRTILPGELERVVGARRFRATGVGSESRYELASWPRDGAAKVAVRGRRSAVERVTPRVTAPSRVGGSRKGARARRAAGGGSGPPGSPGAAILEVHVDDDLLRGAEAPVPASLVEALGIGYRQHRMFASRYGPVALAHDGAGPVRGPLRPIALAAGARRGDLMRLAFEVGGAVSVELLATDGVYSGIASDGTSGSPGEAGMRRPARRHHPIVDEAGDAT